MFFEFRGRGNVEMLRKMRMMIEIENQMRRGKKGRKKKTYNKSIIKKSIIKSDTTSMKEKRK